MNKYSALLLFFLLVACNDRPYTPIPYQPYNGEHGTPSSDSLAALDSLSQWKELVSDCQVCHHKFPFAEFPNMPTFKQMEEMSTDSLQNKVNQLVKNDTMTHQFHQLSKEEIRGIVLYISLKKRRVPGCEW